MECSKGDICFMATFRPVGIWTAELKINDQRMNEGRQNVGTHHIIPASTFSDNIERLVVSIRDKIVEAVI
jgi:hypothetical protein